MSDIVLSLPRVIGTAVDTRVAFVYIHCTVRFGICIAVMPGRSPMEYTLAYKVVK